MAKAKRGTVKARIDMEGVRLTLTLSEAQTLADVLAHIGGDGPPRQRTSEILKALGKAGVKWHNHPELRGILMFGKALSPRQRSSSSDG